MKFGEDIDTGATRRGPRRPRPNQARPNPPPQGRMRRQLGVGQAGRVKVAENGESRAGLQLKTATVAGNVGVTAFAGQTNAQHEFLCTAVEVFVPVANDPALATDIPAIAEFSSNPTIKGKPIMDGPLIIKGNDSQIIPLAEPVMIRESTGLAPGSASLTLGNANMRYSVVVKYLTELEMAMKRRS